MADPRRASPVRSKGTSARRRKKIVEIREPEEEGMEEAAGEEIVVEEEPVRPEPLAELRQPDPEKKHLKEQLMRLQAEFDNYRKRQAREFRRLCNQGKRDLILELLAVLDNFHRAEMLMEEGDHSMEEIAEGLLKTYGQMMSILKQQGLEVLEVKKNDPFDPNIHEAMLAEEVEGLERDTVIEVFQRGYMLDGELLRPARVKVGKTKEPRTEEAEPEPGKGE